MDREFIEILIVRVLNPGSIGGTPCVEVSNFQAGFDWDAGKIIIDPSVPLTRLSPEDVEAIKKSAKSGQSWHAYQSYKKQEDRIKELEKEIMELKSKLN